MHSETILSLINLILLVGYVLYQKFVINKVDPNTITAVNETVNTVYDLYQKFEIVTGMAKKFVILAKASLSDASGEEKRDWVIDKLKGICEKVDLILTDEELKAINESAYDEMCKDNSLYTKNEENK